MIPFSIYLHIPYCQAKCPYCDFNSYAATSWPEQRYVQALTAELAAASKEPRWRDRTVQTIFFGGGTPSLFQPASIDALMQRIAALWPLVENCEVTLEANPGTVTLERLTALRAAGINRISFGVQSFEPHHLQTLGRIHSGEEAVSAASWARRAGFERMNLDLIYALPGQTLAEWQSDLTKICELGPDHISAYNLTYEEGTAFHEWRAQGRLKQQDEDIELEMFELVQSHLAGSGYRQYEISNYARPGEECRHNLNYWRDGDYLGVGAGAHSHAAAGCEDGIWGERWGNLKPPTGYIQAIEQTGRAIDTREQLDAGRARGEFVFLNLRCLEGFAVSDFADRFGLAWTSAFPHASSLLEEGLLEEQSGRCRLSTRGLVLADTVFATFL